MGFHIRTGFADMSQVNPPPGERAEEATLETIDAFLGSEATRVPYPAPQCPAPWEAVEDGEAGPGPAGAGLAGPGPAGGGPLSIFLKCVVATAKDLVARGAGGAARGGGGEPDKWGVFMTTDSPAGAYTRLLFSST